MSLNLITDRTQADVDRYYYFRDKRWSDLTDTEKQEFANGLKGSYNYTDFKRVENAVSYLSNLLNKYGYANVVRLSSEETFAPEYIRTKEEIITYLDNIATLQKVYYNSNWVGKLPTIEEWLDYNGANTIEEILVNIEMLIENMKQVFVYSGVPNSGQERIWQQRFRRVVEPLNYKVFGNVEQATRSGINKLLSFAEGETSYFDAISNSYTSDIKYYKAVPLADNWIHVECDFTDSSINTDSYINSFVNKNKMPSFKTNTRYSIIIEFRNVNKTKMNAPFEFGLTHSSQRGTIWEVGSGGWNIFSDKIVNGAKIIKNDCYSSSTITSVHLLRNFHTIRKGDKFSYDYRISVVEGAVTEYDYEPYGVMPSPNYPSTVYGLGSRTRNIFDINGEINLRYDGTTYPYNTVSNGVLTTKANSAYVHGYGQRIYVGAGNAVTLSAKFLGVNGNVVDETQPVAWLVLYEDNIKDTRKIGYIKNTQKGQIISCSIIPTTDYIYATFDMFKMEGQGTYTSASFTDIQVEVSKQNTIFVPHKAIELKQKIGDSLVDTVARTATGLTVTRNSDGTITINGTLDKFTTVDIIKRTGMYFRKGIYSIIVENDKGKITSGDFYYYYKNDPTRRYLYKNNNKSQSQNFTENVMFDTFTLYLNAGTYDNVTYKFQIVKGSEYKPYTPFIELNKYIDFTNHEPLMKIGDVEDVIDYEKGKILRRIGKAIFDGSSDETIRKNDWGTNAYNMLILDDFIKTFDKVTCMANEFLFVPYDDRTKGNPNIIYLEAEHYGVSRVTVRNTEFSTLEEFKTFLASNPLIVYYQLVEPYYEDIELPVIQKIPGEYSLTAYDEYLDGRIEKE